MKIILRINFKMPTTVGILTFISRINTAYMYESLKARITNLLLRVGFYEQLKYLLSGVEHEKSYITAQQGFLATGALSTTCMYYIFVPMILA